MHSTRLLCLKDADNVFLRDCKHNFVYKKTSQGVFNLQYLTNTSLASGNYTKQNWDGPNNMLMILLLLEQNGQTGLIQANIQMAVQRCFMHQIWLLSSAKLSARLCTTSLASLSSKKKRQKYNYRNSCCNFSVSEGYQQCMVKCLKAFCICFPKCRDVCIVATQNKLKTLQTALERGRQTKIR